MLRMSKGSWLKLIKGEVKKCSVNNDDKVVIMMLWSMPLVVFPSMKVYNAKNFSFLSMLKLMYLPFAGTLSLCFTTGQTRPCLPIGKN